MLEIADWLQKLGLGQYAQRFAKNDITFAILPHLTDQDFKELGIASLGHRRQRYCSQSPNSVKLIKARLYPSFLLLNLPPYTRRKLPNDAISPLFSGTGGLNRAVRAHGTIG